jgi:gluconate 5-dehydrogenase
MKELQPDKLFDLSGRKALVTGGSRGIGLGIARGLALAGAAVAILSTNEQRSRAACEELLALHPGCRSYLYDLADLHSIQEMYTQIYTDMDGVDILVNNAGIQHRGRADEIEIEDFERVMRVNTSAPFVLSQAFARACIQHNHGGSIIMIASLMSEASRPTTSPYTASKGAIRQLVRALAVDWAPYGIRVNGLGPGYIDTEMTHPLIEDPTFDAWVKERTPQGRWGTPQDFAGPAVFLASAASTFITGQILYVDGGWLATF